MSNKLIKYLRNKQKYMNCNKSITLHGHLPALFLSMDMPSRLVHMTDQ